MNGNERNTGTGESAAKPALLQTRASLPAAAQGTMLGNVQVADEAGLPIYTET